MIRVVFGVGLLAVLPSLALAGTCPPAALPNNCDGDAFDDDEDLCPFDASAQNLPTAITYLNTDTPLPTGAACTAAGVEVELGAVLGFGVALRTGARVLDGAWVGDFATVGGGSEDAIVGARATIAPATAPQTGVEFPSGSLQRRASVGFDPADVPQLSLQGDVVFGERVSVSRSVTIGHGARIGNDVVIGYGATIGPGAEIASGAVIGALATIEADTKVGANSVLARGVVLGATSEIGDSVVVGPDVVIGTGSRIGDVGGAAVRIRKSVQIGNNTRIEPGARIGRDANVLADSSVLAGVTLGARVTVEEGAIACSDAAPPAGATCAPGGFYRSGGTVFASDSGAGGAGLFAIGSIGNAQFVADGPLDQCGDPRWPDDCVRSWTAQDVPTDWDFVTGGSYGGLGIRSDGTIWLFNYPEWSGSVSQLGTDTDWVFAAGGRNNGGAQYAIKSDGTIWGTGSNSYQVIAPSGGSQSSWVQIGSDTDWVNATITFFHGYGLKSDGTIWGRGYSSWGQLGTNNPGGISNTWVQVGSDSDWVDIASGSQHGYAIKSDGTLWGIGYNGSDQLSFVVGRDTNQWVRIGSESTWVDVAAGERHGYFLRADGTIWGVGANDFGQLGSATGDNTCAGSTPCKSSMVQVGPDSDWVAVSSGNQYGMALKSDGTIWGIGYNGFGQLGSADTDESCLGWGAACKRTWTQIGTDSDWTTVAAGGFHAYAVK